MNRDEIRARIDALEALCGVQEAIECAQGVEWETDEAQTFTVFIHAGDCGMLASMRRLPPTALAAGLLAMERELIALANPQEVTA